MSWIRLFLLLLLSLESLARPTGQLFTNTAIGVRYRGPADSLVVTNPKTLDKFLTKGANYTKIPLTVTQQKTMGLQFMVTWKWMVKPAFTANVDLVTEPLTTPISDVQFLRHNVRSLGASMQGLKMISQGQTRKIGGRKFFRLEWEANMGTYRARVRTYLRVNTKKNMAYLITLSDRAERKGANFPKLEKLLVGFHFSD
ncbi:hypothetical protein IV102_15115 [bacterium]|nr:hypothetical protein [bacterium]